MLNCQWPRDLPLCCAVQLYKVLPHNNHNSYCLWSACHMTGTRCFTYILSYVFFYLLCSLCLFTFCLHQLYTSYRRARLFFPGVFKTVPGKQVLSRSLNPPQPHEIRLTLTPTLQMSNLKFRGNKWLLQKYRSSKRTTLKINPWSLTPLPLQPPGFRNVYSWPWSWEPPRAWKTPDK